MRQFRKILACLMAAALMCSAAPAALATSGSGQADLLEILQQLYQEQAESEQETISSPALYASVTASEDSTDASTDEAASVIFGTPVIDEGTGIITVDVYVTASDVVNGVEADVTYGDLTYTGAENNENFTVADVREASEVNTVQLVFANANNFDASSNLLLTTLSFTYENAAAGSEIALSCNVTYVTKRVESTKETYCYTATGDTATVTIPSTSEQEYILGDVNGDGYITSADAILLNQYLAHMADLSDTQLKAADVSGNDGLVTSTDAVRLNQYLAHLISSFD